jgi:hypothetical protein
MQDYDATQTDEPQHPSGTEGQFTKTVEAYTSSVPSSGYLGVAIGAMVLSLVCQLTGRGKWGNFIAQWVPTWLIIGLYNKMVKLEGHDQWDRGGGTASEQLGEYRCKFCDSDFSLPADLQFHQKHCSVRNTAS